MMSPRMRVLAPLAPVAPVMVAALLMAVALGACAGAAPRVAADPRDIAALEAAVAARPAGADTLTLLGAAYHAAGRHEDAVAVLARALDADDAPAVARLYLGLSSEALGRWQEARDAYVAYLDAGSGDADVREDVARRLGLVDRALLEQGARELLEDEALFSGRPAAPRSVAVFPFRVLTDDPRFEPLEFALADMVTTDLSIPGVLTLVERAQIQALVREMALDLAGYVEPGTGARVGRLMRAEHVVQGSIVVLPEQQVRLDMALLDATTREQTATAAEEAALEQIFDAEKTLVFVALEALGVSLTPSEREAIEENRTANLIALLAYGEGLAAMQNGDFAAAAAAFQRAGEADPGFGAAQAARQEAASLDIAARTDVQQIGLDAAPELPRAPVEAPWTEALTNVVDGTVPDPGGRYTGGGGDTGPDLPTGPGDNDTSNDTDEAVIGGAPGAGIDVDVDNPTLP